MIWLLTRGRGWLWEMVFYLAILEFARVIGG
jgi:hypothetical protein